LDELEFLSYHLSGVPHGSFTTGVVGYRQQITEGCDNASWKFLDGTKGLDNRSLRAWFDRRLMSIVVVKYNHLPVFQGYVYSMELDWRDLFLQKNIAPMANSILCSYRDENNDTQYTSWVLDIKSINLYGYKEKVITSNSTSPEEAEAKALAYLMFYSNPYKSPGVFKKTTTGSLQVNVKGPATFGDHVTLLPDRLRYHPNHTEAAGYVLGAETTVGDEIRRILEVIQYTSGWMYPIKVEENLTPTRMGVNTQIGAFSRVLDLARLPRPDETSENYERMRVFVNFDGGVTYEAPSKDPSYFRKPPPDGIEAVNGTKPKWEARPGYLKILDPQHEADIPTAVKTDGFLQYVERVEMKEGDEEASLMNREIDIEDFFSDVDANRRFIETWEKKDEEKLNG